MVNIIIVEDHPLFRMGVKNTIEKSGENFRIMGEASNAAELFELLKTQISVAKRLRAASRLNTPT